MRPADLISLLPLCVLAAAAVGALLLIAFRRHHGATAALCVIGLALAFATLPIAARRAPGVVTPLITVDGYALFYQGLIILASLTVALLSYGYLENREGVPREEYYVLLLLATLGAATVVASTHFASFFLGLEILSLSLVALVAYPAAVERPIEASIKYLILSGVSSAFLLFGIALVYTELGTLSFGPAALLPPHTGGLPGLYRLAGIAMILVGIGFKLSVVPFHMWAPDVYEGAPAPVTAFVAVVSKSAVFALLLRYFVAADTFAAAPLMIVLGVIAVLSMLAGNLLALLQSNVKRILAYSSIAHLGYALVAFLSGGALAVEAVSLYLVAYTVMTLGAFGVVTVLSRPDGAPRSRSEAGAERRDADDIADYRGLYRTHPALALAFTAMLLSLAGIPLTAGFIAKFYAVTSGVDGRLAAPVAALVIGSIIGLYYYLRIIVAMVQPAPEEPGVVRAAGEAGGESARVASEPRAQSAALPARLGHGVMTVLLLLLIAIGVYPAPLVGVIRATAVTLTAAPRVAYAASRASRSRNSAARASASRLGAAAGLEQEPSPPLRLVDPHLE